MGAVMRVKGDDLFRAALPFPLDVRPSQLIRGPAWLDGLDCRTIRQICPVWARGCRSLEGRLVPGG
jgi:hypothetical protein